MQLINSWFAPIVLGAEWRMNLAALFICLFDSGSLIHRLFPWWLCNIRSCCPEFHLELAISFNCSTNDRQTVWSSFVFFSHTHTHERIIMQWPLLINLFIDLLIYWFIYAGALRLSLLVLVFGAVFILQSAYSAPLDFEARGKNFPFESHFRMDVTLFFKKILFYCLKMMTAANWSSKTFPFSIARSRRRTINRSVTPSSWGAPKANPALRSRKSRPRLRWKPPTRLRRLRRHRLRPQNRS